MGFWGNIVHFEGFGQSLATHRVADLDSFDRWTTDLQYFQVAFGAHNHGHVRNDEGEGPVPRGPR